MIVSIACKAFVRSPFQGRSWAPAWGHVKDVTLCSSTQTFSVVLTSFQRQTEINWELMCAGAVIQIFPIVLITFLAQRYIISGLTRVGERLVCVLADSVLIMLQRS